MGEAALNRKATPTALSQEAEQELARLGGVLKSLPNAKLEARLDATLRFQVSFSAKKTLVLCCHLPVGYPASRLVAEIRSKSLSQKLTDGLAQLAEAEAEKADGGPQVARTVAFVHNWLRDNPLCSAAEEIAEIKSRLLDRQDGDRIKLVQAESRVLLTAAKSDWRLSLQLTLPNDYPESRTEVELVSSNLPKPVARQAVARSAEIARRCVERPTYRGNDKRLRQQAAAWQPSPCLLPVAEFVFQFLRGCASQRCPVCQKSALLAASAETSSAADDSKAELEFVACGHLYHTVCLKTYMTSPPYRPDGKPCRHPGCDQPVCHEQFRTSARVLESRWAAQQAKERELEEVADFFN